MAERTDQVTVVATGMGWLGAGIGALERAMSDLIAGAQQEIVLTTYSLTPGSERVWNEISRALATGIRCTLVVEKLSDQHPEMRSLLGRLAREYPHTLRVFDFRCDDEAGGLHAKVLVVDRHAALVGSANLSHRGMVRSHELAMVVRGPTAEIVAEQVDRLLRSPDVTRAQ